MHILSPVADNCPSRISGRGHTYDSKNDFMINLHEVRQTTDNAGGNFYRVRQKWSALKIFLIQSNLNSSNTDGSFTMANSNSFLSPYEILLTAEENKYLGKFSHFITILYVVCTHQNHLIKAILMSTLNIQLLCRKSKRFPKLFLFASWPGAMINPQWLELPISRTNFHGPKDVRAIEVWL